MRILFGLAALVTFATAAVAEEPSFVTDAPVGEPMRIAPAVIGQPLYPHMSADSRSAAPEASPKLLIAPAEASVAETAPPLSMPKLIVITDASLTRP